MNINLEADEQRFKDDVLFLAGGDHDLALDLLVRCHAASCLRVSAGYARAGSVVRAGFQAKARVEALDIPDASSAEASSPL